jgi:hypothetical protein
MATEQFVGDGTVVIDVENGKTAMEEKLHIS